MNRPAPAQTRKKWGAWRALASTLLALACAGALHAQPQPTDPLNPPRGGENAQQIEALTRASLEAFNEGDYGRAERACRRLVELDDSSFVHWYNLACALSLQHDAEGAGKALMAAVDRGFIDVRHMRRDPHLAPVRDSEAFLKITGNWSLILEKHRDANLERARREFRLGKYEQSFDEEFKLAYHSAFDPDSLAIAKQEIRRLADWAELNVFPSILDPDAAREDSWVIVILPARKDFLRWATKTFGPRIITGATGIGGVYEHDNKRLIAQDLGASLRHEFFHVLHWRDCVRRGQVHPIWVQEGLCSLIEDYDLEGGQIVPKPSWRTNTAVRLAGIGKLLPLERLCNANAAQFHGDRSLLHYAMARTLFLYLYDQGVLRHWYDTFVHTYTQDPTGILALETVLGKPIDEIHKDHEAWVRRLPSVPEWNRKPDGFVQLGVDVNPGQGEGPVVERVATREARNSGLRPGDIITAINDRPTRDVHELLRVLDGYQPGDKVTVSFRRFGRYRNQGGHQTTDLVLQRLR